MKRDPSPEHQPELTLYRLKLNLEPHEPEPQT